MKQNDLASRVQNLLKGTSKDGRISKRLILKTAQSKAKFLISQKLNDRSLYREQSLYQTLSCIEMVEDDIIRCPIIEFRSCRNLKRSRLKLPELIHSKFGSSVKEVLSLDGNFSFEPTTPAQYRLNKSRTLKVKKDYFYIENGYLYLPDSDIEMVSIVVLTTDLYELEQCSKCSENKCKSAWEYEFICPDKLLEVVIQETIKELVVTKQVKEDTNPNLNENSQ